MLPGMEWTEHYVKLFISHIAAHKALAGSVSAELAGFGVDGFVAHDDINPSREWQEEIEEALQTCDATAIFLHDGFKDSDWTDQEVGYCLARGVKLIPLRFDHNPYGFMGRYQAADCTGRNHQEIAELIVDALLDDTRTQWKVEDGLIRALAASSTFDEANERVLRLERVEDLNIAYRLEWLQEALENSQVAGGFTAEPLISEILDEHPLDQAPPF